MTVIILHGLGRTADSMLILARRLERAGFHTIRINYPSNALSVAALADLLEPMLPKTGRVDFVGHSMGGVLAKHLMRRVPKARQGRIVQLGAPNFGSEIAYRADIFEPQLGPALADMRPNPGTDDTGLDIGAIAGTAALPALTWLTGVKGENDGKVSVKSAWGHAPPEKRIKFRLPHATMMHDKDVAAATIKFLRSGAF